MNKIVCKCCNEEKPRDNFYFSQRDGLSNICRECQNKKRKINRLRRNNISKQRVDIGEKRCTQCGRELDINEYFSFSKRDGYNSSCKDCRKSHHKEYFEKNKERLLSNANEREVMKRRELPGYKEMIREKNKKYRQNNPELLEKINKNKREVRADRYKNDIFFREEEQRKQNERYHRLIKSKPEFKIRVKISSNFRQSFLTKKTNKRKTFFEYIGIDLEEYINHFKQDPLWSDFYENKIRLHIDHIIPCSAYDFTDLDEIRKCWNPRNLRFLTAKENISKNNRMDYNLIEKYGLQDLLPLKVKET